MGSLYPSLALEKIRVTYQWTSAALGLGIAGMILYLIRRDHLHSQHAVWWLGAALFIAVLGLFPKIVDWAATYLNINYPPTLLFILGMGMMLIKVLSIDIHQSRQERKIRRLVQRLALLEAELAHQPKGETQEVQASKR
jgi:hypothetical protein